MIILYEWKYFTVHIMHISLSIDDLKMYATVSNSSELALPFVTKDLDVLITVSIYSKT